MIRSKLTVPSGCTLPLARVSPRTVPENVVPLCVIISSPMNRLALMLHVPESSNRGAGTAAGGVDDTGGCVAVDGSVPAGGCVACPGGMPLVGVLLGLISIAAISVRE